MEETIQKTKILTPCWQRVFEGDFMKLSKLLKKVSVAVSVLMMAGLLAACSSPSGGSSSSDNNNDGGAGTQQQNQNNGNGSGNGSSTGIKDASKPVSETPLVSASDVTVSAT